MGLKTIDDLYVAQNTVAQLHNALRALVSVVESDCQTSSASAEKFGFALTQAQGVLAALVHHAHNPV